MKLERAAAQEARARALVLQVIGLQRSGNHAIIDWISSPFPKAVHLNNLAHDFGEDPGNVTDAADFGRAGLSRGRPAGGASPSARAG